VVRWCVPDLATASEYQALLATGARSDPLRGPNVHFGVIAEWLIRQLARWTPFDPAIAVRTRWLIAQAALRHTCRRRAELVKVLHDAVDLRAQRVVSEWQAKACRVWGNRLT